MKLGTYLRSLLPSIALALLADAVAAFVLVVAGVSRDAALLVLSVVLVGELAALMVDYLRKRPFYADLAANASGEGESEPLFVAELVDRPDFAEGACAYDAIAAIAKAANDNVAAYRRQVEEYREYIETWVHEAKSPLAAAHLMLENLEDAPEGSAVPYEKLEGIGDELRRVEGYIEQALFYARSETVDRDYLIRAYDLNDLVTDAIKAHAPSLIAAHIAPVRRDLAFRVFTDEKWIAFILGQVIENSVKYARDEAPFIEFAGRLVNEGRANEAVELVVRDNGCGVSEADLPRVFEKGFTGENGRTGKRSTGIGLYLVKRLCDKMGVGIAADSVEGSWFAVTLSFSTNKFQYVDGGGAFS